MGAKEKTGGLIKEFKEFAMKGNVIDMAAVFNNCSSLGTLNLEGWNTDNVTGRT